MTRGASLKELHSFGDVAAEDDAVLDYFLTTDAVRQIGENDVFLVLGRKGSGKTALVRHFCESGGHGLARPISLRGYPWNVHARRIDAGASEIEAYVSAWRYIIAAELASLLISSRPGIDTKGARALKTFLLDNYGGVTLHLDTILRPPRLRLSSLSFEPEVLGNKLGGVALDRDAKDLNLGLELNALSESLLSATTSVADSAGIASLALHFDELDQGLATFDEQRKLMLVGLVLAARSIRRSPQAARCKISPVIYLRSDLWDDLTFSDKNKISQTLALSLEWDGGTLRSLVDTRVRTLLGPTIGWDEIATPELMRGSQTKWNHILSRTFLRPRDVIKFLNSALVEAKKRSDDPLLFTNEDIVTARTAYSAYLKAELDDEIPAHWPRWEEALQACSAISTLTFDRDQFIAEYTKRRSAKNDVDPADALRLLYSFSVLGYERRSGYGGTSWAFQYTDPEAGWDASSTRFKVHLGLKEYAKLREERT
jgi:hypothetical protein